MEYALSEDTYRGLFDSMLDGIEVVDATTGRIVLANKVAATLFGFDSPEDMIGIDPLDYIPVEEDRTHIATMFAETFEKDLHEVVELRVRRRDGAELWIAAMGAKVHFDGRLASLASLRDITAHKLTEKNLREVEGRQIQLWDNSSELIAVTQDRKIVFVNRRFEEVFGLPRQALTGSSILDIAHPDDRQTLAERYQRILNGGCPSPSSMLRGIDGHGKTWWGEFREVPFMWKEEPAIMSLIQDVTERKRADEALRVSVERFSRAFDASPAMMIITSLKDGRYVEVNRAYERLTGYRRDEVVGRTFTEVALWSNPEEVERAFHDLPTVGGHRNREVQFHNRMGELRVALLSTEVVEFGGESCVLTAAEDITEHKEAEARERKALEEIALSSRLALVGRLASGVAHEINNPLTVVIGCSQMLMGKDLPQDVREDIDLVYDSAQHVAGIVKGLLTFARGSEPGRDYIDINVLVSRVLGLRAHEMSIYNIEVTTKFAPDLPETLADAGQMQQVFLNIILNAEQSMTRAHNGGNLEIRTARTGDSIRVTFKDDGAGIAKEDLPRLFEPFFTTKEVGEGTGLGLSISYGIIQEHHGRIYARGKPGKGATFVIELPIVAKPYQPEPPDEEPVEEPERKVTGRVLVVDDEPAVCKLLSKMLAREGHNVETVDDAAAALERMKRKRFGLVLLDIRMKGMNGFDLYEQMGKIALPLQKRVLFITGDTLSPDTRGFLEKTEVPCVSKPFDVRQLRKSVNRILAQE